MRLLLQEAIGNSLPFMPEQPHRGIQVKALTLAILILIGCATDKHDELSITNTVCIDGVLCFSVTNGLECDYIPVMIDDNKVRCGEWIK
jgi:hypothetical protein